MLTPLAVVGKVILTISNTIPIKENLNLTTNHYLIFLVFQKSAAGFFVEFLW